jgi:hypothetical protein
MIDEKVKEDGRVRQAAGRPAAEAVGSVSSHNRWSIALSFERCFSYFATATFHFPFYIELWLILK